MQVNDVSNYGFYSPNVLQADKNSKMSFAQKIGLGVLGAGCGAFLTSPTMMNLPSIDFDSPDLSADKVDEKICAKQHKAYTNAKKIKKLNVGDTFNGKAVTQEMKTSAQKIVSNANKTMLKGGLAGLALAGLVILLSNLSNKKQTK